ncbi:MAG: 3,4-dihydroxy-2-butanone-4-phosphate synthase [Desulfurococcales archaeon]|nr:3,4-dihydroxy-2-butanone-4-phosphate synthase [Desulfurococcales archaeon]
MTRSLDVVIEKFVKGTPVLIHDSSSREDETDIVVYAGEIDTEKIYTMRTLGGGLLCYATTEEVTRSIGVPFADEIYALVEVLRPLTEKRLSYGDRPAFTVWVNHKDAVTGIRDKDRALTISKLHEVSTRVFKGDLKGAKKMFINEFQAPGHVPLLAGRGLEKRRGHTELSLALAIMGGVIPSVAFIEMLDYEDRLPVEKAKDVAEKNGFIFVEGTDIIEAYKKWISA